MHAHCTTRGGDAANRPGVSTRFARECGNKKAMRATSLHSKFAANKFIASWLQYQQDEPHAASCPATAKRAKIRSQGIHSCFRRWHFSRLLFRHRSSRSFISHENVGLPIFWLTMLCCSHNHWHSSFRDEVLTSIEERQGGGLMNGSSK